MEESIKPEKWPLFDCSIVIEDEDAIGKDKFFKRRFRLIFPAKPIVEWQSDEVNGEKCTLFTLCTGETYWCTLNVESFDAKIKPYIEYMEWKTYPIALGNSTSEDEADD